MKKVRRILLSFLFRISHLIKSDKLFLTIAYFLWTGHVLHWSHPKRFTEKIQWLKLYSIKPEYTRLVDKYEVKSIVQNIIGYQFVIPTIAVYDSVEDIDVDSLPMQFVMKTTNGGGGNNVLVCKNKADLDINLMKQKYNPQNEAFLHSRTSRAISQNETYRRNTPYPPLKNRPA